MADQDQDQDHDHDGDVLEASEAVNELYEETLEISNVFKHSLQELNHQFRNIDGCFNKQRRQHKKYKAVESLINDLPVSSQKLLKSEYKDVSFQLSETKSMISDLGKSKRRLGSVFLRGIMGHVSVKLWNEGERLQFKQEYNRFKESFLPIHVLLPLLQLYFGWSSTLHQIQSFFTFYYYTSLAIRENILAVNGSRIQPWWIYHHYVTLVSALLFLLISPSHPMVTHGVATLVNGNMLWQAMVLVVQNNYQKQRHYTRKALAKKSDMDVKTSEVIDENPRSAGLYRFLIPALFLTYGIQLLVSFSMMYVGYSTKAEFVSFGQYVQVWLLAGCWLILPCGNIITLLKVLSKRNSNLLINRKVIATQLFFVMTVAKSVTQSMILYSSHLFKSVKMQSSKFRSKKKHASSSKKKHEKSGKHDKKHKASTTGSSSSSKDKDKAKSEETKEAIGKDTAVTTSKQSGA